MVGRVSRRDAEIGRYSRATVFCTEGHEGSEGGCEVRAPDYEDRDGLRASASLRETGWGFQGNTLRPADISRREAMARQPLLIEGIGAGRKNSLVGRNDRRGDGD